MRQQVESNEALMLMLTDAQLLRCFSWCVDVYAYIYICMCVYIYTYVYTYGTTPQRSMVSVLLQVKIQNEFILNKNPTTNISWSSSWSL